MVDGVLLREVMVLVLVFLLRFRMVMEVLEEMRVWVVVRFRLEVLGEMISMVIRS